MSKNNQFRKFNFADREVPMPGRRSRPLLRRSDFSLSAEQLALRDTFRRFFDDQCSSVSVRAVDESGFDPVLWARLDGLGLADMAIPLEAGGGATTNDLALVAEEAGYAIAPIPLVEAIVTRRSLAWVAAGGDWSSSIATIALAPVENRVGQLLPGAAGAARVLALHGDHWVLEELIERADAATLAGSGGAMWWSPDERTARRSAVALGHVAQAERIRTAIEWRLLTAATLVGLAQRAFDLSVAYAKQREAFSVPIGTFQAISHPLVDVASAIEGARRLVWKACWFIDHEPEGAPALARMAFVHASDSASLAARTGIHTQGGFGFTLESDLQLVFRRARVLRLVVGSPHEELGAIADELYGTAPPVLPRKVN